MFLDGWIVHIQNLGCAGGMTLTDLGLEQKNLSFKAGTKLADCTDRTVLCWLPICNVDSGAGNSEKDEEHAWKWYSHQFNSICECLFLAGLFHSNPCWFATWWRWTSCWVSGMVIWIVGCGTLLFSVGMKQVFQFVSCHILQLDKKSFIQNVRCLQY